MTTYSLNEAKMVMDIADGIAIVINSETGIYYGLNAFGTMVLEALTKGADPDQILEQIKVLSGAPTDCSNRLTTFINNLKKEDLLLLMVVLQIENGQIKQQVMKRKLFI